jgi:alkanesulfonate monooxygenase SsuD/methylene tetrahydromethanopterin reductase-like flavin-dependent oxidoreductase (luciferase family)
VAGFLDFFTQESRTKGIQSMSEFLSLRFAADEANSLDQHRLRVVLIGNPEDVIRTIRELHSRGFAEVRNWSILQPIPNSNEVLSVLMKRGVPARE